MDPAAQLLAWLTRVRSLAFTARSARPEGWNGQGRGTVATASEADRVTFRETGAWENSAGRTLRFQNTYRWTRLDAATVRLEHLRRGEAHAVQLLDLVPAPDMPDAWRSAAPHLCGEDRYAGGVRLRPDGLELAWTVQGPRKAEQLTVRYGFAPANAGENG